MKFQFTHGYYLLLLLPALGWVFWLGWRTHVQTAGWRRWTSLIIRSVVLLALVLAIAGLQFLFPVEGMNVFFALDRSQSVPSQSQDAAREYVNRVAKLKPRTDRAGTIVFGTEASIEFTPNRAVEWQKVQAVVNVERTDLAAAIRLGTAAFPETGQKRLVLLTDGNENVGDAMSAVLAAKQLGVSIDILPLGVARGGDIFVQKVQVPSRLKKGQAFEARIFVQSDQTQPATVRLYRDEHFLGEQTVQLSAGKNLFTFPQKLDEPGFYSYDVRVDAAGDPLPQNNRASSFAYVQGDPRILVLSSEPDQDQPLAAALKSSKIEVRLGGIKDLPGQLAEMQSFDSIFLCNVAAGDLGTDRQKLLESAVRDYGIGLVCVGGDQAYAAGGYRGTPLENTLPVSMELDSKKVLPSGAVVLVMHGMEFDNGNEVARLCAQGVLDALGPKDEMGVVLWDGFERWLFPLQVVGAKGDLRRQIAGMRQGDLGSFQGVLEMAYEALKESKANLKHIIVFSDGDPASPDPKLMLNVVADRITVSTVLISGHAGPERMIDIAERGKGRFYDVKSAFDLPQIFIKETAVVLKSAIYEEPFRPRLAAATEVVRGVAAGEYPTLLGYVATSPKTRAETPLWTDKNDPLLAHWQYGLGRAVAFTSDARAKWARSWMGWEKYRQFWSQIGQWSLRRLENADLTTEVTVERGEGVIQVEALDSRGEYRNFLNLQAVVNSPTGERQVVRLEQAGPGYYEARFPTREIGPYLLNVMEIKGGKLVGSQVTGASVNYSPEFNSVEPNLNLLQRIADSSGGKLLDGRDLSLNSFRHDRKKTFQPRDMWETLLRFAVILFTIDVGVRRIQVDREEWLRATQTFRRLLFRRKASQPTAGEESLAALLARRDQVRATRPEAVSPRPDLFQPDYEPAAPLEAVAAGVTPVVSQADQPSQRPPAAASSAPATDRGGTTSRLLEAKRRASRRTRPGQGGS